MTVNGAFALVTATVALVFWGMLLDRHLMRPRPSTACWLIGLGCYAIGVGCQALAELGFLDVPLYKLWYLAGAFFAAAYLGAGSLHLLTWHRFARWATRALVWASIIVAPAVVTAPVDLGAVDRHLLSGSGFPDYVRLLTPAFNVFGTIALVGVALRRGSGAMPKLIATGSLVTASGATLLRFGVPGGFYVSQFVGILLMWLGFLAPPRRKSANPLEPSDDLHARTALERC